MRRLLFLLVFLTACSTPGAKTVERPPEQQAKVDEAIKRREVLLGMTESEVLAAWGKPQGKRKATIRRKPVVVWSYIYSEIYFDVDGFVVNMSAPGY
ncbi:MAG: hypothetical protein ACYTF8_11440 [Planctomycetota bacterium]|jgi:hypothetical protein